MAGSHTWYCVKTFNYFFINERGYCIEFFPGRGRDRKRKGKRGKNFILKWEGYLMRTFSVLHVHCGCLSGMSDQSNSSSNLECCDQPTSSQSPQWGKAPITSMYKKACLTTASSCRVEGSRVSMLSACSSCVSERQLPDCCESIFLAELADGTGDLCNNLLGCHPRLWTHWNYQQFPHSDTVRQLKCLQGRHEEAGI